MNENISAASFEDSSAPTSFRAVKTIFIGGLTAGIMDCLAATISAGFKGVTFEQVWQYVASGLLGKNSAAYGMESVALGLAVHFSIAFSAAAVYYLLSLRFPVLTRRTILCGIIYALGVYFFMRYVVTPLSLIATPAFSLSGMLTGILIHIFCVGLPIAFVTRCFAPDEH